MAEATHAGREGAEFPRRTTTASLATAWDRHGAAPFLSSFTVVLAVALADGGYFRETWLWATLALLCLASLNLVLRETVTVGRLELAGVAALTAFAAWIALSAAWSPTPGETLRDAERAVVYLAAFLAGVFTVDRATLRQWFCGIAGATVVVMTCALVMRTLGASQRDPTQGTLLIEPFGYANAAGIFAALGLLVALALILSARTRREQAAWSAGAAVLIAALAETETRGAWLALAVGLLVLVSLVSRRARRVGGVLALGLALVAAAAFLRADRPFGDRLDYWQVALSQWQENVWAGSGAGTFARYWLSDGHPSAVLDAHNLYLETVAELGLVGLALVAMTLCVPVVGAVRARGDPLIVLGIPAYLAFLVHAGVDWDWEMPAVTLVGLFCGIGAAACGRKVGALSVDPRARAAWLVFAFAMAAVAVVAAVTSSE